VRRAILRVLILMWSLTTRPHAERCRFLNQRAPLYLFPIQRGQAFVRSVDEGLAALLFSLNAALSTVSLIAAVVTLSRGGAHAIPSFFLFGAAAIGTLNFSLIACVRLWRILRMRSQSSTVPEEASR